MTLNHQPCPDCGSSDALTINDDGSTKCFSCGKFTGRRQAKAGVPVNFVKGVVEAIPERFLNSDVCRKYNYRTGTYQGEPCHIATYRDLSGTPIFQKIRFTNNKDFITVGKFKPLLYGMHLFAGSTKKLIITEGEIDCLSVAQTVGDYPVVSIPNGADNAAEAIKKNIDFVEQFEEVVFLFDNDKHGIPNAKACAALLSVGKAKIVTLPLKDANDMLKAGRVKELFKATWNGLEYRPDGIVSGEELWDLIDKPIEKGLSYPFQTLTDLTYGIREAEMIVFGAGTGMGKTEFFKEIEAHLITEHKQTVGIIHLEEQTKETVLGLMGKYASKKFHIPDIEFTEEEKKEAFNAVVGTGRAVFYDGFGTTDFETIKNNIRYMVVGKGCKYIFLDHITALADGVQIETNVNQFMRKIVSELASLTRELKFTLFTISHLRKPEGKPHEEGGRVHLDDMYGAAALKQWATYVIGLERNQQAENEEERHTTTLRILKDRYTGLAAGHLITIKYNKETGKLTETNAGDFLAEDESSVNNEGNF